MHPSTRTIRILANLVDILVIAVIAVALGGVVLGRVLPALGHPVFVVGGPSMSPTMGLGDAIVLEQVEPDRLVVGDVVSLRTGPSRAVYTHRIVRVAERDGQIWIETKGDANGLADPSITPASAVVGRVTGVVPVAGFLLALLSVPVGVVFVLATGALLIALGWCLDGIEADRRRQAYRAGVAAIVAAPVAAAPERTAPRRRTTTGTARRSSRTIRARG